MDLLKTLSRELKTWEKLDRQQKKLDHEIDGIYQTSAVGQAPPVYHRKVDQLIKVGEKKAEIWNKIRGYCANSKHETLWQLAAKDDQAHAHEKTPGVFFVAQWGVEECCNFTAEDIKNLIQEA